MKASQLLQHTLSTEYGVKDGKMPYMCIALFRACVKITGSKEEVYNYKPLSVAESLIHNFLYPTSNSTLAMYLYENDEDYLNLYRETHHDSDECHEYRVQWWKKFILDLESKGL